MTNNQDDFEQHDMEPGEELPPQRRGMAANLTEAWRTRPLFKLIALMTVVAAVIGVSISIFSGGSPTDQSRLVRPPSLNQPAGGQASPYFIQQTKEAEAQRAKEALQSGGSALPTPIGQSTNLDELAAEKNKKDPLVELRAETEHLKQELTQVQQQQQRQAAPAPAAQQAFDDTLAQAMQRQMQELMNSWNPHGVKQVSVTKEEDKKDNQTAANANGAPTTPPLPSYNQGKIIVPAGTVNYAQLLVEANSDVPGPILAQILSGPLAGARAVGRFTVMNDYLVLQFTLVSFKGKDYSINALALDPDTTLGGMATDIDERWISRVLLPAAAGFMQGLGSALAQGSSSVVTNGTTTVVQQSGKGIQQGVFQGLAQVGQTMSQYFQNEANNTKPLIRVAAGTPMGLFFTTSVRDTSGQTAPYGLGYGGPGYPGYPGYPDASQFGAAGYPGAQQGVPGYGYGAAPAGYYPGAPANTGYPGYGYAPSATAANTPYPGATVPYPPAAPGAITPGTTTSTYPYGYSPVITNH